MKKLLFAFPIIALFAAGCNSSQQVPSPTPAAQHAQPSAQTTQTGAAVNNDYSTQTYSNSNYGFSIKIPKQYSVDEQASNEISFNNAQNVPMIVISIGTSGGQSLSYFVNRDTAQEQKTNSEIAGETAVRVSGGIEESGGLKIIGGGQWVQYGFIHNGYYYNISKPPVTDISVSQFDDIVSSFKFTE